VSVAARLDHFGLAKGRRGVAARLVDWVEPSAAERAHKARAADYQMLLVERVAVERARVAGWQQVVALAAAAGAAADSGGDLERRGERARVVRGAVHLAG